MTGGLDDLKLSIGNLLDEFGSTEHLLLGLAINAGLAFVGILVWAAADGWLAFAGAFWALLNGLGIFKWVFQL